MVSGFAEDLPHSDFPEAGAYCEATATAKMQAVLDALIAGTAPLPDVVIAADSIVVTACGAILEKAGTPEQAAEMIRQLAGTTHRVITVVVVATFDSSRRAQVAVERETTQVAMCPLSEEDIQAYVARPDAWQGKAGAYGIQDLAARFITGIIGDYYTVMGLPIHRLASMLNKALTLSRT